MPLQDQRQPNPPEFAFPSYALANLSASRNIQVVGWTKSIVAHESAPTAARFNKTLRPDSWTGFQQHKEEKAEEQLAKLSPSPLRNRVPKSIKTVQRSANWQALYTQSFSIEIGMMSKSNEFLSHERLRASFTSGGIPGQKSTWRKSPIDLPQPRFWIRSGLPTIWELPCVAVRIARPKLVTSTYSALFA